MVGDTSPAVDAVVGVHYLHGNTVKNESGDLILIQSIFRDDTGLSKDEGLDSKLSELPLSHLSLSLPCIQVECNSRLNPTKTTLLKVCPVICFFVALGVVMPLMWSLLFCS